LLAKVVDEIYEAAFAPEKWEAVLDKISRLSSSMSAALMVLSDRYPPRGVVTPSLAKIFNENFVGAGDWEKSIRVQTMLKVRPRGFVLVDEFVPPEQSLDDPVSLSLRAHGMSQQLCTMIPTTGGDFVTFTTERSTQHGHYTARDIDFLNDLRPHLARGGLVAARLGLERAQATVSVLNTLGLPAAVLTQTGYVIAANPMLEQMSAMIMPKAWGGLIIADAAANMLYNNSIAQMRSRNLHSLQSIPVPGAETHSAAVLHILPMRGDARDIFAGAEYLMVVSTIDAKSASPTILGALFDLTPAEARLAEGLLSGDALSAIARHHGVSITTVRTQLSSIFAKTGTSRQAQLVALLSSLWVPQDH